MKKLYECPYARPCVRKHGTGCPHEKRHIYYGHCYASHLKGFAKCPRCRPVKVGKLK
jgi:hypothetical protein